MKLKIVTISLLSIYQFLYADTWTLSTDNDLFFQSDDAYTAAIFVSWMGDEYSKSDKDSFTYSYTSTLKDIFNTLPLVDLESENLNASMSLQEIMMTPNDLTQRDAIYNDVPYSGTLATHFSLYAWQENEFDEYRISVGLIGPLSGSEQIQKTIHTLTGSEVPMGWDNQIDNYFLLNVGYLKGMKNYEYNLNHNTRLEWFNSMYFDVGNYYIGAGGGSLLRIGQNMPHNFNTPSALMSISPSNHLNFTSRKSELGWAANIGINANFIAYMYIQEIAQKEGYNLEDKNLLVSMLVSFDLYYENMQASLEFFPSKTSKVDESSSWGRISFTWYME